ncbi:MAG: DNA mismatch repair endonuclease MutL [Mariniblastus sp.]|nr:DNA mismatch repair endonuclease MutL [Mariniblastus sp.]
MTQAQQLNPIRQLSASVVNKIAAGEVIERPASVVKELLENAVDAGSTQIELTIEQGGIDLIRVTDNGHGIPQDQLPLAVTSHATSKISDADDLFRVGTFGFRGEALASIAEISQTVIRSRPADQDCGFEMRVSGGHREPEEPCGCPVGTTIEVRQLFYNTPVRQKFMKTPQTERGHIAEAFTRVALANPQVQMIFRNNTKVVHQLPATDSWRDRIGAFFGPEISDNLIPVSNSHGEISITGFVVDPSVSRANNRLQYLFLNSRYIRDRSLQHALSESYRGLLMTGRFPVCFLKLSIPFEMVDVNVHPAKLEVRFQNGGQIYSQLLSTVRNKFLTTDLTAQAQLSKRGSDEFKPFPGEPTTSVPGGANAARGDSPSESQERISFQSATAGFDWTQAPRQPFASSSGSMGASAGGAISPTGSRFNPTGQAYQADSAGAGFQSNSLAPGVEEPPIAGGHSQPSQTLTAIQVHNTYLISETVEGMLVIDQHALHERVIYEQIRDKVLDGKLESQKLLVPEPVSLPPAEAAAVLDQAELLSRLGIAVEPFGGDTVLVSAYPAMLANHNPAEMLRGVVDQLINGNKQLDQRDLVDELLHMISCKAAVKAGDKLSPEEITALLEHRELCQDAHHCPHGRPTSLLFSREELDRRFKRI